MTEVVTTQTNYEKPGATGKEGTMDGKIYIHTGNIANWNNVKSRKSNDMPANELYQSLYRTAAKWAQSNETLNKEEVFINRTNSENMDENERGLLKVTAKIFLQNLNPKNVKEATQMTLKQLGSKTIDALYLALPPLDENASFADVILPFWEEMESLRDAGIVAQISSCDLDRDKLKTLIEMVRIRPEVNQVNLTSCCHIPEDLVQYAKEMSIVLHTHGDQPEMLPEENLESLMQTMVPNDKRTFTTDWIVRYAVVVKCRGVIKSKGYIASVNAAK